jgi:hypothetical protein
LLPQLLLAYARTFIRRLWVPRPSPQSLPTAPRSTLMLLHLHLCPCSLLNT